MAVNPLSGTQNVCIVFSPGGGRQYASRSYTDLLDAAEPAAADGSGGTAYEKYLFRNISGSLAPDSPSASWGGKVKVAGTEKYIHWEWTGIFDEAGQLTEILGTGSVEQTGLTKAERSGRRSVVELLDAYRRAIDTNIICTITDERGMITYANEKFLSVSQYSLDEVVGRSHNIVNSGYHPADFFKTLWKTISSGHMWKGEIRNRAKDGSLYWVETIIVPIKEKQSRIKGYLSLRTLITEQKKMEEDRNMYFRSLEDMLFMVSHELRAPIARSQGLINMLTDSPIADPECVQLLGYLNTSVTELDGYSRKLNAYIERNIKTIRT